VTDRDVRAMLRGAVAAKVIVGWYWYGFGALIRYVVHAGASNTVTHDRDAIVAYCGMLRDAGVEPLYREPGLAT